MNMTTTLTVKVNGAYQRDVRIGDTKPVTVGPDESRDFSVPHGDDPFTAELSAERAYVKPDEPVAEGPAE
jgi:hypothetical protein